MKTTMLTVFVLLLANFAAGCYADSYVTLSRKRGAPLPAGAHVLAAGEVTVVRGTITHPEFSTPPPIEAESMSSGDETVVRVTAIRDGFVVWGVSPGSTHLHVVAARYEADVDFVVRAP